MSDLISKEKFLESLIHCEGLGRRSLEAVLKTINKQPTVNAVPVVHAKWIAQNDSLTRFMCSNCKSENHEGFETYCPKCGALMDLR